LDREKQARIQKLAARIAPSHDAHHGLRTRDLFAQLGGPSAASTTTSSFVLLLLLSAVAVFMAMKF